MILVYYIISILIILYGSYFVISTFTLFKKNPNKIKHFKPKHKIAIIIAARNEEQVMTSLIKSLKNQNYPSNLYEIIVVPNNCTDRTEELALLAGATIFTCDVPVKTKGEVLRNVFERMGKEEKFDAYLIFDADNVVKPNFLKRINDSLCSGYLIATGYRDAKNPYDTYLSGNYTTFYLFQNVFFNIARMNVGRSCSINGTGFVIHKDYLKQFGYEPTSLAEDIELMAFCAEHQVKIGFIEDAITYDEQPTTFSTSWKQRKRWVSGGYQCLNHHFWKLLKLSIKDHNQAAFDTLMIYLSPVATILGFILFCAGFFIFPLDLYFLGIVVSVICAYAAVLSLELFAIYYRNIKPKRFLGGILTFPIFVISWLPIYLFCLFKKNKEWEHIPHHRNLEEETCGKQHI